MPEGDQIDIARGVARDLQSTITEQREVQETAEDSDGKMGSAPTEPIVRNEYGEITNPSSTRHADDYERDASEAARLYAEHQQSTKPTRVPPLSPAPAHENAPRPSATLTEAQVAQRDLYRIQVREAKNAFFAPIADKNVPGISEEEHAHLKALETDFRRKYPDRAFDLLPQQEQNTAHMRALRRRLRVFLRDVGLADPKNLPTIVLARIPEQAKAFDGRALVDANVILLRAGEARADMETLELVIHEAAHLRQVPRIREMAQTPGGEAHLDDLYDELMQGFRENPDIRWLLSKHPFDRPHRDSELLLVESFAQAAIYFTLGHKNSIAWLPAFHDWQQGLLYDYPEATTAAQDLRDTTGDKKAVLADAAGARGTVSVSARGPVRQKSGASGATGEVEARRLTPALPKVDAWLADPATQGTRLARLSEAELRELAADVIASAPTGKGAALLAKIRDYQQAHEAARKLAATSATTWARQLAQLSAPALRQLQRVLA
ncbi:MAG: hypothetical protein LBO00_07335, partial [Zoogloeaceae bacterium]|nr:hypothetical protein [Zoogloeaceae bacterium]